MRVWIDDVRPMPRGYDVWIKTYAQAYKLIHNDRYNDDYIEHISFDHDLGGHQFVTDPHEKTGYDIACIIERYAHDGLIPRMTWDVHSANPAGALRITQAMKSADRYWDRME